MDHSILLKKLEWYGFETNTLDWFTTYLHERSQRCFANGYLSDASQIRCGVPQGSVLGPLLFLLYINDLPNCLTLSTPRMFAGDTHLTNQGLSTSELETRLNPDLENVKEWLLANKLSINTTKTEYMLIGSKYKLANCIRNPSFHMGRYKVESLYSSKSLGVYIRKSFLLTSHRWNGKKDLQSYKFDPLYISTPLLIYTMP